MLLADTNVRVSIRKTEAAEEDYPDALVVERGFEAVVYAMPMRDRVARMDQYSNPLTHTCFCAAHEDLTHGCQLLETHRRTERGEWETIVAADAQTYLVLGIERIPGVPAPYAQLRLDLWQMNAAKLARA
jgi:hypothetical protein